MKINRVLNLIMKQTKKRFLLILIILIILISLVVFVNLFLIKKQTREGKTSKLTPNDINLEGIVSAYYQDMIRTTLNYIETSYGDSMKETKKYKETKTKYFKNLPPLERMNSVMLEGGPGFTEKEQADIDYAVKHMKTKMKSYYKLDFPNTKLNDNLNLDSFFSDIKAGKPSINSLEWIECLFNRNFDIPPNNPCFLNFSCEKKENCLSGYSKEEAEKDAKPVVDIFVSIFKDYGIKITQDTKKKIADYLSKLAYLRIFFRANFSYDLNNSGCPKWKSYTVKESSCKKPNKIA